MLFLLLLTLFVTGSKQSTYNGKNSSAVANVTGMVMKTKSVSLEFRTRQQNTFVAGLSNGFTVGIRDGKMEIIMSNGETLKRK